MDIYTARVQGINTSVDTMRKTVTLLFYNEGENRFL